MRAPDFPLTRMREYARTHKDSRIVANREQHRRRAGTKLARFALLLEFDHGGIGRNLDLAVDDGALGDGDRARTDTAPDHRGVADLEFVFDDQSASDLTGNDGLIGVNRTVPVRSDGKVEGTVQFSVAVYFAGDYEMTLAADVPDDDGVGADDGRRRRRNQRRGRRRTLQKSTFGFVHRV
jgi:hypothetical protein